jgi:hypothetical protein
LSSRWTPPADPIFSIDDSCPVAVELAVVVPRINALRWGGRKSVNSRGEARSAARVCRRVVREVACEWKEAVGDLALLRWLLLLRVLW